MNMVRSIEVSLADIKGSAMYAGNSVLACDNIETWLQLKAIELWRASGSQGDEPRMITHDPVGKTGILFSGVFPSEANAQATFEAAFAEGILTRTRVMAADAAPAPVHAMFNADEMGFLNLADIKILSAVATGRFDLNRAARELLANRGLDANGKWVGFDKAGELLAQEPGPLRGLSGETLAEMQGFSMFSESPDCAGVTRPLRHDAGAPAPDIDGEQRKVVVVLTGGIVDQVLVGEEGISVAVIDYDKNADLDDLVVIPQGDGTKQYALASIHDPEVNPARVDELYAAVEVAAPAAEDEDSPRRRP